MEGNGGLTRRGFLQAGILAGAGAVAASAWGCAPQAKTAPDVQAATRQARTHWLGEEPLVNEADIVAEESTDLLIIGAGNAGMVAAATASDLGLDFIVAEKAPAWAIRASMWVRSTRSSASKWPSR